MPPIIYGTSWKKEKTSDLVTQAILAEIQEMVRLISTNQ